MQKNIFEEAVYRDVLARLEKLTPETPRQWGKMDVAQMLAHLTIPLKTGLGELKAKKVYLPLISPLAVKYVLHGGGFGKGLSPTMKEFIVKDSHIFDTEKQALVETLNRVITLGKQGQLKPHPFFGKMNPTEWGIVTYSHVDHHLRQFGV